MNDPRPSKFRFTLSNLLLAMLPLSVMFIGIGYLRKQLAGGDAAIAILLVLVGLSAAGGALSGGVRGMGQAMWQVFAAFLTLIGIVLLMVLFAMVLEKM